MLIFIPHNHGLNMTDGHDKEVVKDALKDALKEWLDEKFATFGKWSLMSIGASFLIAVVWFIFWVEFKKT